MTRTLSGMMIALMVCGVATAQEPQTAEGVVKIVSKAKVSDLPEITPSTITPEMYIYLQEMRRHDDPQQVLRRREEYKANQRLARITSQKWYGMSNSRPQATAGTMMGSYSPMWVGNGYDRFEWTTNQYPLTYSRVLHSDYYYHR